ncbi:biosynthetic peptidoglycan transglycosylase [Sphingobacterium anhuiense]|uniref:Biosynthetic peptidoglycan transglycosylase n=1 Tax=Sphingobacterium anhuiense TaxID=493780 RepID=A0ABW5YQF5_9SPHI
MKIICYLFFVCLKVFASTSLSKKIFSYIIAKIAGKYHIDLHYQNFRITNINILEIYGISVSNRQRNLDLSIDYIQVHRSAAFKRGKLFESLKLESIILSLHNAGFRKESDNTFQKKDNYLKRIKLILSKSYRFIHKIIISDFEVVGFRDLNINCEGKYILENGKAEISEFSIFIQKSSESIFAMNADNVVTFYHFFERELTINFECHNVSILSDLFADKKINANKINADLAIIENDDNKNINIKTFFIDGMNLKCNITFDSNFLEVNFGLNKMSIDHLKAFFGNFVNRSIYEIDLVGQLEFSGVYKLDFKFRDRFNLDIDFMDSEFEINSLNSFEISGNIGPLIYVVNEFGLNIDERDYKLYKESNYFTPLLKQAVVMCEDPSFYTHSGIDFENIGFAISNNINSKRISRGASTITMQLSRNLFLNHKRNIYRKVEEVVIALIIENLISVSKDKILEVYLNIIEFAPNIRGIESGAIFYFSKNSKDLNLIEIITLIYIIPRPYHFLEALKVKSPILIENLGKHINSVIYRLKKVGLEAVDLDYIKDIGLKIDFAPAFGSLYVLKK